MKQFEKWFEGYKKLYPKHFGPMFDLLKPSYEKAWREGLGWVLNNRKPYYDIEDKKVVATDSEIIEEELES